MAKKNQNGWFIVIFRISRQLFNLVGAITFHVSFPNLLFMLINTSSRTILIMAEKIQNDRFIAILPLIFMF